MAKNITVYFADGSSHSYQGVPDEVTAEQAIARAQSDFSNKQVRHVARSGISETGGLTAEPPKERPGFFGSFKEAMEILGLTDEAAVYAANPTAENRKKFLDAAKSKYESVGGFGKGENWEAFKELLGSSLGQMVAPISAATVGSLATPITGVVAGTSAIASQYGVQSLLRQAEEQERAVA